MSSFMFIANKSGDEKDMNILRNGTVFSSGNTIHECADRSAEQIVSEGKYSEP